MHVCCSTITHVSAFGKFYSVLVVDGRGNRDGATFDVLNPATESVLSQCANAGPEDVDEAVKAARAW